MAPSRCWRALAEHPFWKNRAEWAKSGNKDGHGRRGTGLAVGGWIPGLQPTGATVRLDPDGSVSVLTGQVDIAGTNIALAQIAASAYGIDTDKVRITTGDTDTAPMTGLSAGSKTIYTVGTAVLEAAKDAGARRSRSPPPRWRPPSTTSRSRTAASSSAACRTGRSRSPRSARRATSTCPRCRRCSA